MKLTADQLQIVKDYGHLIVNTGGNDIVELCERKDINMFSNVPTALLQSCVQSQVILLTALMAKGHLI